MTPARTRSARSRWSWSTRVTASSDDLLKGERDDLLAAGWTRVNGDTGDERAAQSPGHKLRVTYASASGDLKGHRPGLDQAFAHDHAGALTSAVRPQLGDVGDARARLCLASARSGSGSDTSELGSEPSRPSGPTAIARRPASRSRRSAPTSSRRQPVSVRTSGSGSERRAAATISSSSLRDAISSYASPASSARARSSASASAISGASPGSERPRPGSRGIGGASRPRAIASRIASPRSRDGRRVDAADLLAARASLVGWRLASSTSGGSPRTEPTGRSSAEAVRSRQAASSRATARERGSSWPIAGQPLPDHLGVALVGRRLEPPALLARPLQPAASRAAGAAARRRAPAGVRHPRRRS